MDPLLPIITRSIIGNNGSINNYYWPGQLGDEMLARLLEEGKKTKRLHCIRSLSCALSLQEYTSEYGTGEDLKPCQQICSTAFKQTGHHETLRSFQSKHPNGATRGGVETKGRRCWSANHSLKARSKTTSKAVKCCQVAGIVQTGARRRGQNQKWQPGMVHICRPLSWPWLPWAVALQTCSELIGFDPQGLESTFFFP